MGGYCNINRKGEKMRKRKTMKKALPVALAVVLLLSMFALGASAETTEAEEFGLCEHWDDLKIIYPRSEAWDVYETGFFTFTCDICNVSYKVGFDPHPNVHDYYIKSCSYYTFDLADGADFDEVSGSVWFDIISSEDGVILEAGLIQKVTSVEIIPLSFDGSSNSMVGSMVTTVTAGLGGILVGIGSSIVTFFDNTVLDADGNLTTFAIWALAFLGIAFALGVVKFITFLVKRK